MNPLVPMLALFSGCLTPPDPAGFLALQAEVAELQALVGETEDEGLRQQVAALQARLEVAETALGTVVTLLSADTTLHIPGAAPDGEDLPDVHAALRWLATRAIGPDATVTIQLASGTHTLTEPVVLRHPNGDRIRIVGQLDTVLRAEGVTAIEVGHGAALGELASLRIESDGGGEGRVHGIHVHDNGVLTCGLGLTIAGFSSLEPNVDNNATDATGILVERGGTLNCGEVGLVLSGNRTGAIVREHAVAVLNGATVSDSITEGLWVYGAATLFAEGATVDGTQNSAGIHAAGAVYVDISYATVLEAGTHGVSVSNGSFALTNLLTIERSQGHGVRVDDIGAVKGADMVIACNGLAGEGYYDAFVTFSSSFYGPGSTLGSAECPGTQFPSATANNYDGALLYY